MVGITDTNDGKILEDIGDLFVEIATIFPSNNYTNFCNQLSIKYAQSQRILKKHMGDYEPAVIDVLNIWEGKGNPTRAKLESAMEKANSGALRTIVEKHFAMVGGEEEESDEDGVNEEEEESDEDGVNEEEEESDEDGVNEEEEESDEEPVTVHQSGGSQTINASGRSKVKGSTMTGPVTNLTIYNHPAEASSSQSQGGKRKAAVSSGGKKRVKMGGKR